MVKRAFIFTIVFSVFLMCFLSGCSREKPAAEDKGSATAGDTAVMDEKITWGDAPDFTASKVEGGELTLSSLKDKIIVLNFWAVKCPVCEMQTPKLVEFYEQYKDKGVEIVGVGLNDESLIRAYVESLKEEGININYPLVFANSDIVSKYHRYIRYVPTTFVIDADGNVAKRYVGYVTERILKEEIDRLRKEEVSNG